jgi:hypothetical protein
LAAFIIFRQQQNPHQCFCFGFFHVAVLVLLAKQQQQKIVHLYIISVCYAWALGLPEPTLKKIISNPPYLSNVTPI